MADNAYRAKGGAQLLPEVLAALRAPRPGLLLFAHATVTSEEQPLAADVTESDEELARRVLATAIAPEALADLDELRRFAARAAPVAPPFVVGERERAWVMP